MDSMCIISRANIYHGGEGMKMNLKWFVCLMVVIGLVAAPLFMATPASADKLSKAIEQGINDGKIDKKAEPGFLGIPGAP